MPVRSASAASVRDGLLAIAVAAFAFVLGAVTAGMDVDGQAPKPVFASPREHLASGSGNSGDTRASDSSGSRDGAGPGSTRTPAVVPRLAPDPFPAPTAPAAINQRFFGDGAGRQERVILPDPYSRRAYVLETASLMHRRGWIGLEDRADEATTVSDVQKDQPQIPEWSRITEPGSFMEWTRAETDPRQLLTRMASLSRRVPRSYATDPDPYVNRSELVISEKS